MRKALKKFLCITLTLAILLPSEVLELSAVDWVPPRVNSYSPSQSSVNVDLAFSPLPDFSVFASDLQAPNNDLIIDFGQYGAWRWDGEKTVPWTLLHNLSPKSIVCGDIDGDGYDEAIMDFDQYGIWSWDPSGASTWTWTQIHTVSAKLITMLDIDGDSKSEAIMDFDQYGVWSWDPDLPLPWTQLHSISTKSIVCGDIDGDGEDEAIIDFDQYGIWSWDPSGASTWTWTQVHTVSAESITMLDFDGDAKSEAIMDFGQYGVWSWDPAEISPWVQIHSVSTKSITECDFDGDNKDEAIIDFDQYGIWLWEPSLPSPWTQIHTVSTKFIVKFDFDKDNKDEAVMDFDQYGIWSWDPDDTPNWTQIHTVSSDSIDALDFDSDCLTYNWEFDSAPVAIATGNTLYASDYLAQATIGDHTVKVTVSDGRNAPVAQKWSLHITRTNLPPTITSYTPNQAVVNIDIGVEPLVDFSITTSDPDSDTLTYAWKFDGQVLGPATGATLQSSVYSSLATVGDHTVQVLVNDGHNPDVTHEWTLHITQTLNNPPSIDSFSPTEAVINIVQGDNINFQITASDPDSGDTLTYSWTINGAQAGTNSNTFAYSFGQPGQFIVKVTVTDGKVATPPFHEWTVNTDSVAEALVKRAFKYFWQEADPTTGLIRDRLLVDAADPSIDAYYNKASIAATGFGLVAMCVAAENYGDGSHPGWQITPTQLADRTEKILDTLLAIQASQDPAGDDTWGKDGFFYHFVKMDDGSCHNSCEVSSIDTAIAVAGALTAGEYFSSIRPSIATKARQVYLNVKWSEFVDMTPGKTYKQFYKQWTFNDGFAADHWDYTDESLLLYLLAIGSKNTQYSLDETYYYSPRRHLGSYGAGGRPIVQTWFGSLFAYQFPHAFFDLYGKHDTRNIDWWQNTTDAAIANRQFCIDQDGAYGYNQNVWGLSSSYAVDSAAYVGEFGAPPLDNPPGPTHDGTVNPSVVASSIEMLPLETGAALLSMKSDPNLWRTDKYGFIGSFKNSTPRSYADYYVGIDLGSMLAAVSNNLYSGIVWNNFMNAQTRFGNMNDLLTQVGFKANTDHKHYIDIDDISEKSQFAYGIIDSTTQEGVVSFNMTSVVPSSKYMLGVHAFMNDFAGSYDVQVKVLVNGVNCGDTVFSHTSGAADEIKYIELDSANLQTGENILTLRFLSGTSWLAWKNIEVSSPVVTNTWTITRTPLGNEYRVDDTYYASHAVIYGASAYRTFEQALNSATDPYTDILFYVDDVSHGRKLTLTPFSSDGDVYIDVSLNGQPAGENINMSSTSEVSMAAADLQQGWNRIRLQINDTGGEWVIWNQLVLELGPSMIPPKGLAAASFGKTAVNLRWLTVNGTNVRYNIYRSPASGGPYSKINSSALTSPQYQDTGLSDNTTYYYAVTAFESAAPAEESARSPELALRTGSYELDYGDGRDPNSFGGTSGAQYSFVQGITHNWVFGKVRALTLSPNESGSIGLNNVNLSSATVLSLWIKATSAENIQIGLKGADAGDSQVNVTTATGWQNVRIRLSDFSGVSFNRMDKLYIKSLASSGITVYLDDIEFTTENLGGNSIWVVTKRVSDNANTTGMDFDNNTSDYAPAKQYIEVKYSSGANNWKIWVYTKNDNGDPAFLGGQFNGLMSSNGRNRVPLLWRVYPSVQAGGVPCRTTADVYNGSTLTWNYVKDKNDSDWASANQPGAEYSVVAFGRSNEWAHLAEVPPGSGTRDPIDSTFRIYLGGIFKDAPVAGYSAKIYFDLTQE